MHQNSGILEPGEKWVLEFPWLFLGSSVAYSGVAILYRGEQGVEKSKAICRPAVSFKPEV